MPKEVGQLIEGYRNFREQYFNGDNPLYDQLATKGQQPKTLVIACSDARVDPAHILNCQPGDLFVVRNVANLVPPFEQDNAHHGTSAALEFGICALGIRHVIVFGHTQCGGIRALIEGANTISEPYHFISKWMELAHAARDAAIHHHTHDSQEEKETLCERYSLIHSLQNLYTFPWIKERVNKGELFLHAWYFDLTTGFVYQYDEQENNFRELEK